MRMLVAVLLVVIVAFLMIGCTLLEIGKADNSKIIVADDRIIKTNEGDINMKLTSNAFKHNGIIPRKYTCQGDDINPGLKWEDVPKGTKSFALIVDDPDAPRGTWVHWLVKDIPADKRDISENSVPGTQVMNDFDREDYGGPCPPYGVHRYFFKLYALDTEKLEAEGREDFYKEVEKHKIEETLLMAKYSKS